MRWRSSPKLRENERSGQLLRYAGEDDQVEMHMRTKLLGLASVAWLSLLGLGALPGRALADDQSSGPRTLNVRGEGTATAVPNLAWLRLGVDTQAAQAQDALRSNADAMAKVIAALKTDGVADKDVQTSNLSIAPVYPDDPKKPRAVVGYRVGNTLTVRIRDLEQIGAIVDKVVALGSNDIAGLSFDLDDPTVVQNEARAGAVRDAIAKAKLYADKAGVELGPIMRIAEETTENNGPAIRQYTMMPAAPVSTPVESGELAFHAVIDMTWSIK